MINVKITRQALLVILPIFFGCTAENKVIEKADELSPHRLWYTQPARSWMQEALPIGNGYMGAMFFGGTEEERIQFNEESLWAGGKGEWEQYNGGNREGAHKYLPQVRKLLAEGKFDQAHALANRELTGVIKASNDQGWIGFGAYQAFGDLYIQTAHHGEVSHYERALDISEAVGSVSYQAGQTNYRRTYFGSYPGRALVFRFQNDAPHGTDYTLRVATPHKNTQVTLENDQLILSGALENNGMEFESRVWVDPAEGKMFFSNGELYVKSTKTLTLYLVAATDYQNEYPVYKGRDYHALNDKTIKNLQNKGYDKLLNEHQQDYKSLYSKASLYLGEDTDKLPTNERLKAYASGTPDPALEALYFQYGRYLMISSSRPGTMPANLQGKWNDKTNPPWASDYHANINIQMIYWPAELTNLAACHEPLLEYIDKLRAPGRKTAKDFFNTDGWIVNTMNNPFGFTAPGWDFPWGFFPGGAAWYARHVWEHYDYSRDVQFLQNTGYPIMKEAALFWLDYLTEDPEGYLVSSPSYSPEHGGISTGAYMDIQIVWDLFTHCILASEIVKDTTFGTQLKEAKSKLLPLKIGRWGQLQEWKEDRDDPNNKHRHVSHLYALYPGRQVSRLQTPELAEAAKVSLNARGDEGTGWSIAWKINFWARLFEGDRAYKLLRRAMQLSSDEGVNMMDGGGVYANLLSTHPPFQLDGNMGATAGIAEMLVQSHVGAIHLLPALPEAWPGGRVSGIKARGGFEVTIKWADRKLVDAEITSLNGGSCKISYSGQDVLIETRAGKTYRLDASMKVRQE